MTNKIVWMARGIIAAAVVCAMTVVLEVQVRPYRAYLQVHLVSFDVAFGSQGPRGQAMVYGGEPLIIEVGISNRYDGPRAGAELDWPSRINLTLKSGRLLEETREGSAINCEPREARRSNARSVGNYIELSPYGYQYVSCQLDPVELGLRPGVYTVKAEWSAAHTKSEEIALRETLSPPLPLLAGFVEFELRDVTTDADRLDRSYHLAGHAWRRGQYQEGLAYLDDVLTFDPNSVAGWSMRAQILGTQRNCVAAVQAYERVVEIIENDSDTLARRSASPTVGDSKRARVQQVREAIKNLRCK